MNLDELKIKWQLLHKDTQKEAARRGCDAIPFLCDVIISNKYLNILEIGTFLGRTACHMAAACSPFGGVVTTININSDEQTKAAAIASDLGINNIEFVVGDSLQVIPALQGSWDLVFIDGHHSYKYTMGEYKLVCDWLAPKAMIVFDDVSAVHPDSNGDGGVPRTVSEIEGAYRVRSNGTELAVVGRGL